VRCGNIDDVARQLTGPYDGVISSFAALNTVDLAAFAPQAARLLRPGGRLVCHMLSTAYGQPARRRLLGFHCQGGDASAVRAVELGGTSVPHLNIAPDRVYERFFAKHFERRGGYALGLLVSGSLETHLPAPVLDVIGRIEPIVGAVPAAMSRGRFFVLDLERLHPA